MSEKINNKNKNIKLSVAIPTYNRCNYLMELIPNLLEQCYEADKNYTEIEVIIGDNASTDTTSEYILKNFSNNKRMKYYRNAENIGANANFIKSVERASGQYVWLFGDDELLKNNAIVSVLNIIKKYSSSLLIVKDESYNTKLPHSQLFKNYSDLVLFVSKKNPHFLLAHTLVTANIFLKDIFDIQRANDFISTNYGHMYAILEKLKNGGSIYVFNEPIIQVRKHRAEFSQAPENLLFKQAKYINYVGTIYNNINIKLYSYQFIFINLFKQLFYRVAYKIYKVEPIKKAYKKLRGKVS